MFVLRFFFNHNVCFHYMFFSPVYANHWWKIPFKMFRDRQNSWLLYYTHGMFNPGSKINFFAHQTPTPEQLYMSLETADKCYLHHQLYIYIYIYIYYLLLFLLVLWTCSFHTLGLTMQKYCQNFGYFVDI